MDLTTATRHKTFADIAGSGEDTLLGYLITAISAQVEDYLDRYAESTSRTVYLDVDEGQRFFVLRGYPVSSVTSVYNDSEWGFGASTLVASTEYTVLGPDGFLRFPYYELVAGPGALKVTYVGGMAANTAAFYAAFPAVELAVWAQVSYLFDKRKFLADTSASVAGSSVGFQVPELLPEVVGMLKPYRRSTIL